MRNPVKAWRNARLPQAGLPEADGTWERGPGRVWERWRNGTFGELFGADLRSLAALRIVLGLLVLMDLAGRIPDLRVHYTDDGVLPRDLAIGTLNPWRWSLNLYNGTEIAQWIIFTGAAVAAGFMVIGFRTRIATVVVWVLIFSIQTRNPLVLSGADTLLRVLLFWAMLLPLGAYWSLDRSLQGASPQPASVRFPTRWLSWATLGIFLQIALMYWFTALLKTSPIWRTDGTALSYATGAGQVTRPFAEYLHQFPDLLRVLTHLSYGLEVVAPFLLFSPFRTGPVRTLAALAIMTFHAGIFLTFDIGIFPWTSAFCMVCFLPAWFWDDALPSAWAALKGRSRAVWRVAELAPQAVQQRLIRGGGPGSGAILSSAGAGNAGADFGTVAPPVTPPPVAALQPATGRSMVSRSSPFTNIFAALCLAFVLAWNVSTVSNVGFPRWVPPVGYASGLYQRWDMFSPNPPLATSWYIVRGILADGQRVDLLTPVIHDDVTRIGTIAWEDRPDNIAGDYYKDKYWRKYLDSIASNGEISARREFMAYTCRMWNDHYGGPVTLQSIDFMSLSQRTSLDGRERPVQRSVIDTYRCVAVGG